LTLTCEGEYHQQHSTYHRLPNDDGTQSAIAVVTNELDPYDVHEDGQWMINMDEDEDEYRAENAGRFSAG